MGHKIGKPPGPTLLSDATKLFYPLKSASLSVAIMIFRTAILKNQVSGDLPVVLPELACPEL